MSETVREFGQDLSSALFDLAQSISDKDALPLILTLRRKDGDRWIDVMQFTIEPKGGSDEKMLQESSVETS